MWCSNHSQDHYTQNIICIFFKYNLIAVHSLALCMSCILVFTNALCILHAPWWLVIAMMDSTSYVPNDWRIQMISLLLVVVFLMSVIIFFVSIGSKNFDDLVSHTSVVCSLMSLFSLYKLMLPNVFLHNNFCMSVVENVDLLWHNKLGHVSFVKLRNISTPSNLFHKTTFLVQYMSRGKTS